MNVLVACLAGMGAVGAVLGTVYSLGWLILIGGFTLLVGALAMSSVRLPR